MSSGVYLAGFADEASSGLSGQIRATKGLGWNAIEARNIDGCNIHDLSEDAFEKVVQELESEDVYVNCFGSAIANWAKDPRDDFSITMAEVQRAVVRMKRLGTRLIRIMSYKRLDGDDQMAEERFRRLREIVAVFLSEGLQPVHENCMNYGGMSWQHTIDMLENVPGLKLVFDTGNPVFLKDYSKGGDCWQDGWEFYCNVREHVAYIHIKDCINPTADQKEEYCMPGEGQGYVKEIISDLYDRGYAGGISIEPHLASVFHDPNSVISDESYELYVEYGCQLMKILDQKGLKWNLYDPHGRCEV